MSTSPEILFLIHSVYLYFEPARRVSEELDSLGCASRLLCLLDNGLFPEPEADKRWMEARTKAPIDMLRWMPGTLGSGRFTRLLGLAAAKRGITNYLRRRRPALAVVGNDVGDPFGRLFIDICEEEGIPVLILAVVIGGPSLNGPSPLGRIPFSGLVRRTLRSMGLEGAVLARNWVTGSYSLRSLVAVPSERASRSLKENGIDPGRVRTTGTPVLDLLAELIRIPKDEAKRRAGEALGAAPARSLVVYCTDPAFYRTAEESKRLNSLLRAGFAALSPEALVVVKLHPRETRASAERFASDFSLIAQNCDMPLLLRAADLVIGHESAALRDAALIGTPILSLRLGQEDLTCFDKEDELTHLTRWNDADFAGKVRGLLERKDFRARQAAVLASWCEENGRSLLDGRCAARVAQAVQAVVEGG